MREDAGGAPPPITADGAAMEGTDGAEPGDHTCDGGPFGEASDGDRTPLYGVANVELDVSGDNEILGLETTVHVPRRPNTPATFFVWPGLQPLPGGRDYEPVGNGVLQTVLTWGETCAPGAPADPYTSWWVSAEYVNPGTAVPGVMGCLGGDGALVEEGAALHVVLERTGAVWSERVMSDDGAVLAHFEVELGMQAQGRALFAIERSEFGTAATVAALFTGTRIALAHPEPAACQPAARGSADTFAVPRASRDGRTCCIDRITLASFGADPR